MLVIGNGTAVGVAGKAVGRGVQVSSPNTLSGRIKPVIPLLFARHQRSVRIVSIEQLDSKIALNETINTLSNNRRIFVP